MNLWDEIEDEVEFSDNVHKGFNLTTPTVPNMEYRCSVVDLDGVHPYDA